jgi:hypothetical protein
MKRERLSFLSFMRWLGTISPNKMFNYTKSGCVTSTYANEVCKCKCKHYTICSTVATDFKIQRTVIIYNITHEICYKGTDRAVIDLYMNLHNFYLYKMRKYLHHNQRYKAKTVIKYIKHQMEAK